MPQGRGEQIKAKEGMKSDDSLPVEEGVSIASRKRGKWKTDEISVGARSAWKIADESIDTARIKDGFDEIRSVFKSRLRQALKAGNKTRGVIEMITADTPTV